MAHASCKIPITFPALGIRHSLIIIDRLILKRTFGRKFHAEQIYFEEILR